MLGYAGERRYEAKNGCNGMAKGQKTTFKEKRVWKPKRCGSGVTTKVRMEQGQMLKIFLNQSRP